MSDTPRVQPRLGFREGPLTRPIDRTEARSRLALLLTFLFVSLPLAAYIGITLAQVGADREADQQAERYQVTARLVADAPEPAAAFVTRIPVAAEWTDPDGSIQQGVINASPGDRAGSVRTIWIDSSGHHVTAPQGHDDTLATALGAALLSILLFGVIAGSIAGVVRYRCNRRRFEMWDAEWARVGPEWGPHRA